MTTRDALAGIVGALEASLECNHPGADGPPCATCHNRGERALKEWRKRRPLFLDPGARSTVMAAIEKLVSNSLSRTDAVTEILNAIDRSVTGTERALDRALFGGDPEEGEGR